MKFLIVGDSQANGKPGQATEARLRAQGHTVMRVARDGHGPVAYQHNTDGVRDAFLDAVRSFSPDVVLGVWGHNPTTAAALQWFRGSVPQPVYASGPPSYPNASDQVLGDRYKAMFQSVFGDGRYIDAYAWTPVSLPRDRPGWHFTTSEGGQAWGNPLADELLRRAAGAPGSGSGGGGGGTALGPPVGAGRLALAAAGAVTVLGLLWWLTRRPVRRNRRRRR
jgi:hypothetical protein